MMPFKKNRNEAAYFDGKKHFIDVIKNTGDSRRRILILIQN